MAKLFSVKIIGKTMSLPRARLNAKGEHAAYQQVGCWSVWLLKTIRDKSPYKYLESTSSLFFAAELRVSFCLRVSMAQFFCVSF